MEIRWGIIGCGDATEVKSGPAFQRVPGSKLVAVTRRDRARAEDYARRHGVPHVADDARALVAHPEVDAVYVATPPGCHLEHALLACAAKKPCYVEKPMARNATECRRMVEAFREANVPLFVAYYRRALPRFLRAKELLATIGDVTGVSCRYTSTWTRGADLPWRVRGEHSGGGLFLDVGCHTLDVLDFLLGPLRDVSGVAKNVGKHYDVEDAIAMTFTTESGAPGAAMWDFSASERHDLVEIFGTKKRLAFATFGSDPIVCGEEKLEIPNPAHIQEPFVATMVAELLGQGTCASHGESAMRTSEVMDRVLDGYYGGRADAFWERREAWPR